MNLASKSRTGGFPYRLCPSVHVRCGEREQVPSMTGFVRVVSEIIFPQLHG